MQKIIVFSFLYFLTLSVNAQTQEHANSLFSAEKFFSFINDIEYGEDILIKWDFDFTGSTMSDNGEIKYYNYRLNHTFDSSTEKYDFDIYSISDGGKVFNYQTSSNKNFLEYKKKMLNYGFKKIDTDSYNLKTKYTSYYLNIKRTIHSSGSPNYYILLGEYE